MTDRCVLVGRFFHESRSFSGWNTWYSPPSDVEEIWWQDFEYAIENCPGGIYTLTMHPEFIGRGHRLKMLDRLIDRMKDPDGVTFTTLGAYAMQWRQANPIDEWKIRNPLRTGVGSWREL